MDGEQAALEVLEVLVLLRAVHVEDVDHHLHVAEDLIALTLEVVLHEGVLSEHATGGEGSAHHTTTHHTTPHHTTPLATPHHLPHHTTPFFGHRNLKPNVSWWVCTFIHCCALLSFFLSFSVVFLYLCLLFVFFDLASFLFFLLCVVKCLYVDVQATVAACVNNPASFSDRFLLSLSVRLQLLIEACACVLFLLLLT